MIAFEIAGLPKIISNGSKGSWRSAWAEARKWHRLVYEAALFSKQIPDKPYERARLKLTRHSSMSPDFDGLCSSFKHVIDGLIKSGVIVNDKFENIGQPEYLWIKAPPKRGKIRIEVMESCDG